VSKQAVQQLVEEGREVKSQLGTGLLIHKERELKVSGSQVKACTRHKALLSSTLRKCLFNNHRFLGFS